MHWKVYFITASLICIIVSCIITGNICYSTGYEQGSEDWYELGSAEGFLSGYESGHDEGYLVGFDEGLTGAPSKENAAFIGNVKSHVFHSQKCGYLPYEKNRAYFVDRQSALDAGYHACSRCLS